jgi:hypothetical protein
MTQSSDHSQLCGGSLTRRDFLHAGSLLPMGLGMTELFAQRSAEAGKTSTKIRAKSCILIWLDGGPSHLETFDLKPSAPKEVRGPFQSRSTKVPGIQISELLPQTAEMMKDIAIVRSMTSPLGEHNFGTHYLMTGYKPTPVLEYATYGSVLTHLRKQNNVLPGNIAIPDFRVGGGRLSGNGFLPISTRPFSLGRRGTPSGDPAKPGFRVRDLDFYPGVTATRLNRRQNFLRAIDAVSKAADESPSQNTSTEYDQAHRLITSKAAKTAFDLSAEPAKVRNRYGRKTIGQSCLLARRLVERGVPFVTVNNRGWDTHNDLYTRLKEGFTGAKKPVGLIPSLDLGFSALIADLKDRGLLDETLVVVMGEFGRTPKLNTAGGRDHWPRVFSVALAGGGIQGGQIIGSSDSVGESPKNQPVTPKDLAHTIYILLGINPAIELKTSDGRPVQVNQGGKLISGLVG